MMLLSLLKNDRHVIVLQNKKDIGMIGLKLPDLTKKCKFTPNYTVDDDEWMFLDLKDHQGIMQPFMTHSTSLNKINKNDHKNIVCLYLRNSSKEGETILFSRVFRKQILSKASWINLNGEPEILQQEHLVSVSNIVHAFWSGKEHRLYFKKFSDLKPLFKGVDGFYRDATDEEVGQFLNLGLLKVSQHFAPSFIGDANRKKIALLLDEKMNVLNERRKDYLNYAKKYKIQIKIASKNKFVIESNKDITHLMIILEEKCFTSEISGEKRITNSARKI